MKNIINKSLITNIAPLSILVLAFSIVIYIIYLLIYPFNPLVVYSPISIVNTGLIKPGDKVSYRISFCKNLETLGKTVRTLIIDDITVSSVTSDGNVKTGCTSAVAEFPIPLTAQKGKYHIDTVITYQVNVLRTVIIRYDTEDFNIV